MCCFASPTIIPMAFFPPEVTWPSPSTKTSTSALAEHGNNAASSPIVNVIYRCPSAFLFSVLVISPYF